MPLFYSVSGLSLHIMEWEDYYRGKYYCVCILKVKRLCEASTLRKWKQKLKCFDWFMSCNKEKESIYFVFYSKWHTTAGGYRKLEI